MKLNSKWDLPKWAMPKKGKKPKVDKPIIYNGGFETNRRKH